MPSVRVKKVKVKKLPPKKPCWNCEEPSVRMDDHNRPVCETHEYGHAVGKRADNRKVCPECSELELLHTYDRGRMCSGCYHGEKMRACENCGDAFVPKETDTYTLCAECYDAGDDERPHCDDCDKWSMTTSHRHYTPDGEHMYCDGCADRHEDEFVADEETEEETRERLRASVKYWGEQLELSKAGLASGLDTLGRRRGGDE